MKVFITNGLQKKEKRIDNKGKECLSEDKHNSIEELAASVLCKINM